MSAKIWLINLVLAAAVVFLGVRAYRVWSTEHQWSARPGPVQEPIPPKERNLPGRSALPETEYEPVVGSNLFHPDRKEAPPAPPPPPATTEVKTDEEPKVAGPQLKILERFHQQTNLYGVVIVGDHREALLDFIPGSLSQRAGPRSIERARVGDMLGMFKVKEIGPTSVILTAGGYEWPVSMFDKDKPQKRLPAKTATGPVVIGDAPKAAPAAPTPAASGQAAPAAAQAAAQREALKKALTRQKVPPAPPGSSPLVRPGAGQVQPPAARPAPQKNVTNQGR